MCIRDRIYSGQCDVPEPNSGFVAIAGGSWFSLALENQSIAATIDIDPDTINLKSNGKWITAYIELPVNYNVYDIDILSIKLKMGETMITAETLPSGIGDYDDDGIADLMVKFDLGTLIQCLMNQGITSGNVTLKVDGQINANFFTGIDSIRIID